MLDRIQLGRVARQGHRLQSFRLDEVRGGLMHLPAVPDNDDAAAEVVVQIAEEGNDVFGLRNPEQRQAANYCTVRSRDNGSLKAPKLSLA
jgi:hypothetical protein